MSIGALCAGPLLAEPAIGLWQTQPDRKNLISHIQVTRCGDKLCGIVLRAFDGSGKDVVTRNVGKTLFWDLESLGGGKYGNGTVYVPLLDVTAKASMELRGDQLRVTGCKGKICDGQTWTRVR
ncbi:DUF2147 domain-containing protein [Mesobacterium sp. TK19101]|uniref:DUF2147 domain-containing protein n=1 Tax=Mesobacterium hydrothermale TaxID=3111907 RepID=A0ABU6HE14_9RHOB|nr:DUF2147 domain-containing protein [Mesobacterium sp. TK19101]MEC3860352.1 DUF2147 domain-containing protein [Mesobacterium sp. TK19101]